MWEEVQVEGSPDLDPDPDPDPDLLCDNSLRVTPAAVTTSLIVAEAHPRYKNEYHQFPLIKQS